MKIYFIITTSYEKFYYNKIEYLHNFRLQNIFYITSSYMDFIKIVQKEIKVSNITQI